ncbi:MAG: PhzF family phenazine biosynthesis protein [Anaerolineae bacterium]|nr:PhzF family phenazine biosynthesis protein [Anaerolineae bacterium]
MLVDAFTQTPLQGNPCLVVLNADALGEDQMQAIAREANLSETAFVLRSTAADVRARYFTPAEEIPLAGHPTMAVSRALIDTGRLRPDQGAYRLELQAGVVEVEIQPGEAGLRFVMAQKPPRFLRTYAPEQVAPAFGLSLDDLLPGVPIQTVSTGTPQLMIPVRDLAAVQRVQMNHALYIPLRAGGDFFSPHVFCLQGYSEAGRTFARHFGTPPDTQEDPFTGSATGGMAAYLWHYGLIDSPRFIAEQGHGMQRPGQAFVEVVGSREAMETVKVGGYAVTVMRGEMVI